MIPRNAKQAAPAPSPIAYTPDTYTTRYKEVDYTRAFEATLAGYGTLSYCSVLTPKPSISTIYDEEDNGILVVKNSNQERGTYQIISWTPNKIVADIQAPENSEVTLNANYAKGWQINNAPARELAGRPASPEKITGNATITFAYHAPGFTAGRIITLLTIVLISTYLFTQKKKGYSKSL